MDSLQNANLPGSGITSILYVCLAAITAIFLAKKTEYFWYAFVVLFWLLAQPILNAYYVIELGLFDLQPNRLLLLFLMVTLLYLRNSSIGRVTPVPGERLRPPYEIYMVVLAGLIVLAMPLNWNALPPKKLIAIPLESITLILLYFFMKRVVTTRLLNAVLTALVVMAVSNSVIALIQFANPLFLRTGPLRSAFGNVFRAFGPFTSEYDLGGIQIPALFVILTNVKNTKLKLILATLVASSIILTFHRMGILILFICIVIYLSKYATKSARFSGMLIIVVGIFSAVPAYIVLTGGQSQLVDERLSDDTISGRFGQFGSTIKLIVKHPLGLGNETNPIFQETMIEAGHYRATYYPSLGRSKKVALPVHNGYLAIGMKYGIAAMVVFTLLVWKMLIYFYGRTRKAAPITVIPFFAVLVWALSNLSNGIIEFRAYSVLVMALLAGLFAGAYRKGLIQTTSVTPAMASRAQQPIERI